MPQDGKYEENHVRGVRKVHSPGSDVHTEDNDLILRHRNGPAASSSSFSGKNTITDGLFCAKVLPLRKLSEMVADNETLVSSRNTFSCPWLHRGAVAYYAHGSLRTAGGGMFRPILAQDAQMAA